MAIVFETAKIENGSKADLYKQIAEQAHHLVADEANEIANLSNVSALLNLHMKDINWVGFYLWHEETKELVLGPFQGKPACIRIGAGKGVCGAAASKQETVVVQDVLQFPGHIACDADSRSEVVVPIVQESRLVGVLDIDSPQAGTFDEEDAAGLEQVVQALVSNMKFSIR